DRVPHDVDPHAARSLRRARGLGKVDHEVRVCETRAPMVQRTQPSRAFLVRDAHRKALTWHFVILSFGLVALFAANRFATPERFWAHWAAVGWGVVFLGHLALFARGTLESMGAWRKKKDAGAAQGGDAEGRRTA